MSDLSKPSRLESIDYFRGLAIMLMVLANFTIGIVIVPGWLKHASDIGLTIPDLIAPFFIFAIGLTFGLSVDGVQNVQAVQRQSNDPLCVTWQSLD
jgi:predicted acyltransferase